MDRLFSEYKQKDFLIKLVFCNGPVWTLEKPASRFLKGFTPKEANNIQTRLLPANLNNWRAFLRNFVSKYHKKIDLYEIGAEYDLFLGDNLYYRKLYPDMINHGLLCKGPVIDLYSEMIKQGEKEILAIDPEAKIGAIRPSNVDCERNFPFSGAVFKKSGKSFNVFPLDPYTYPRRIGPQLPPTRDPEYLNEIFDNAIKMAAQYGQNQSIYVSELAWYHYTIGDFNNEYEKTAIRKMLRSCLLSRTYDQMLHWMWMGSGWYESLGTPLCYWGIYPSPLLPAYSMLAQIVENVSESKELILSQTTKSFVFKKNTSATGAIWSVDNKQKKLSLPYNAKLALLDVMGNPVKIEMHNNIIHIPINGTPVYFSMEGENAFKKILDIISNGKIEESPLKIAFRQTGINKGEILLTNLMSSKLNGEFSISMSKKVLYEKNFSIPKNNKESFEIPLIKSKEKEKINVAIACQGKERINASFPYNLLFSCPQINKTIMIDGKADEEKDHLICFKMDKRKQIMPPDPWINWSGVEDLSGKVFLGWNKKFIYIYAQIIDDKHFNNKLGAKCYDGDALQLAFDFENDATLNEFSGYDKNDIDVIVALTKTGKTSSRLPKGSSYEIIRNEKEKTTCYEIVIPIESFKRNLAVKKVIGFNFVIFDDDDGTGATYYYQFSPGITQNKNPAMFHKIILEE
jgi:hypothetical protein